MVTVDRQQRLRRSCWDHAQLAHRLPVYVIIEGQTPAICNRNSGYKYRPIELHFTGRINEEIATYNIRNKKWKFFDTLRYI